MTRLRLAKNFAYLAARVAVAVIIPVETIITTSKDKAEALAGRSQRLLTIVLFREITEVYILNLWD